MFITRYRSQVKLPSNILLSYPLSSKLYNMYFSIIQFTLTAIIGASLGSACTPGNNARPKLIFVPSHCVVSNLYALANIF